MLHYFPLQFILGGPLYFDLIVYHSKSFYQDSFKLNTLHNNNSNYGYLVGFLWKYNSE